MGLKYKTESINGIPRKKSECYRCQSKYKFIAQCPRKAAGLSATVKVKEEEDEGSINAEYRPPRWNYSEKEIKREPEQAFSPMGPLQGVPTRAPVTSQPPKKKLKEDSAEASEPPLSHQIRALKEQLITEARRTAIAHLNLARMEENQVKILEALRELGTPRNHLGHQYQMVYVKPSNPGYFTMVHPPAHPVEPLPAGLQPAGILPPTFRPAEPTTTVNPRLAVPQPAPPTY